jgi:hypothetical protein
MENDQKEKRDHILEELESEVAQMPINYRRAFFEIDYDYFLRYFTAYGNKVLKRRGYDHSFDLKNEDVIKELYYWLVRSDKFKGDPVKGILLVGRSGIGKSYLLEVFMEVYNSLVRYKFKDDFTKTIRFCFEFVESRNVDCLLGVNNHFLDNAINTPYIISDLAKEPGIGKDYGNIIKPVSDFLYFRSEVNSLTMGTANYVVGDVLVKSKNKLVNVYKDHYGESVEDRFYQLFNVIKMKGENFRRKSG